MLVLVACEFSGVVRDAFRRLGHEAWSCDLPTQEPEGEYVNYHLDGDVRRFFRAQRWDLMIAHPPCTYLCNSGARWWKARRDRQLKALDFVQELLDAPIPRIAVENPPGRIGTVLRPADQYIQPWQFGHGEVKKTGLWLKNLPLLRPTKVVTNRRPRVHWMPPGPERAKNRSRTYRGIAEAMAHQWGRLSTITC